MSEKYIAPVCIGGKVTMHFRRRTLAGLAALGVGVPLTLGFAPAGASEEVESSQRTIDLDELRQGAEPMTAWMEDGTIRTPDGELAVSRQLDITSFAPVGPSRYISVDQAEPQTGDSLLNRLVGLDEDGHAEFAEAPVTAPFVVSATSENVAWAEPVDDGSRLVLANADTGDVVGETVVDSEVRAVGFVYSMVVVEDASGLGTAQVWLPGIGLTDIPDSLGATATDAEQGLASVIIGFTEDPETGAQRACSSVVEVESGFGSTWTSCEFTPLSFSPDGQYVWAQDSATDGLGANKVFLVDAETGEEILELDIEVEGTTQRVSWEQGGSVLFDAWTGGDMAIVRCATTSDGDCELATEPQPHENPIDDEIPYLLAERW